MKGPDDRPLDKRPFWAVLTTAAVWYGFGWPYAALTGVCWLAGLWTVHSVEDIKAMEDDRLEYQRLRARPQESYRVVRCERCPAYMRVTLEATEPWLCVACFKVARVA